MPSFWPFVGKTARISLTIRTGSEKILYTAEHGDYSGHLGTKVPCSAENRDNSSRKRSRRKQSGGTTPPPAVRPSPRPEPCRRSMTSTAIRRPLLAIQIQRLAPEQAMSQTGGKQPLAEQRDNGRTTGAREGLVSALSGCCPLPCVWRSSMKGGYCGRSDTVSPQGDSLGGRRRMHVSFVCDLACFWRVTPRLDKFPQND